MVPLLSVVLPVYNGLPYLKEAVDSILQQTLSDFELLIIDDGSTDGSSALLSDYSDPRVRVIRTSNQGIVPALNLGVREARSPIVARMDADDVALPTRLHKQFHLWHATTDCVALSCNFQTIDDNNNLVDSVKLPISDAAIRFVSLFRCPLLHPGAMFSKEAFLKVGGYRPKFKSAQDYDLWVRLLNEGRFTNHPEALMLYRVHSKSISLNNRQLQLSLAAGVAASYAPCLDSRIKPDTWERMYLFHATGEHLPYEFLAEGNHAFEFACQRLTDDDRELNTWISSYRERMRWRCQARAKSELPKFLKSGKWLLSGLRFDIPKSKVLTSLFSPRNYNSEG